MGKGYEESLRHICFVMPALSAGLVFLSMLPIGCSTTGTGSLPGPAKYVRPIPENAQILFLSNQDTGSSRMEIYSMDAQGGGITRITATNEQHFVFGIDSSHRYIVATRGSENQKRLWLLDLQTGEEKPITRAEDNAEGRSFSPDGEWIVFWMVPAGEQYSDIYKVRRDGSELVNLTNTPLAHEFDPAWSNNGDRIAFTYNNGQPNRFVLKVMDADGTNIRVVYDPVDAVNTPRFPAGVYDPSWSRDDEWILGEKPVKFSSNGENGGAGVWHIFKVSADGKIVEDLTGTGELADKAMYLPCFSPDGEWVVASARYGPESPSQTSLEIIKMSKDGTNVQRLTDSPYMEQFPVWVR
jgi:Tol biopolymer transport system component